MLCTLDIPRDGVLGKVGTHCLLESPSRIHYVMQVFGHRRVIKPGAAMQQVQQCNKCSGAPVQWATMQRCNGATVQRCSGATVQQVHRCNGAAGHGAAVQRCNNPRARITEQTRVEKRIDNYSKLLTHSRKAEDTCSHAHIPLCSKVQLALKLSQRNPN